jgi:hypothetical protein
MSQQMTGTVAPIFELEGVADAGPAMLNLWQAKTAATEPGAAKADASNFDALSFAAPGAPLAPRTAPGSIPIWRVNLSTDELEATATMQLGEERLKASQSCLDDVTRRVDALVRAQSQQVDGPVSFGAASLPPAESDLLGQIAEIKQEGAVSFALEDGAVGGAREKADEAAAQMRHTLKRLTSSLLHYAAVETYSGNRMIGRTTVSWTGDSDTLWPAVLATSQAALHQRSLRLAVRSRDSTLRVIVLTVQTASKLSVLLATPGGVLLALPVAWRFINQVLAELGDLKEIREGGLQ